MHTEPNETRIKQPPIFNLPRIIVLIIAFCAGVYAVQYLVNGTEWGNWVLVNLALIPLRFSAGIVEPQWSYWLSPLSYSFLHGNVNHLVVNMLWLAIFGSPLALRMGTGYFLLFWVVTAIASAFMHYLVYPESVAPLVGASGAISGMTGAATRFAFRVQNHGRFRAFSGPILSFKEVLTDKTALVFVIFWFGMNFLIGAGALSEPNSITSIAWQAHIGGFLAGFFLLPLFITRRV